MNSIFKNTDKNATILIYGKVFTICGALIGVVPLFAFVSIPLFIIGLFLIWKSALLSKKNKIYWTVIPLLSILAIWLLIIVIDSIFIN